MSLESIPSAIGLCAKLVDRASGGAVSNLAAHYLGNAMIWIALITLIFIFILGFRLINAKTRRATQMLAKRLKLDVVYVESLISHMGETAGAEYVSYLAEGKASHLANAAAVLLIYQTFILDESEENLLYWQAILDKARLPSLLSNQHLSLALHFLRELEPDAYQLAAFRQRYNALAAELSKVILFPHVHD